MGVDGMQRRREDDAEISKNMAHLFTTETGKEVLKYLRSITIELVHGANVTNEELRHVEGQRYLVGLIESRITHAHKVKNNE